MQRQVTQLRDAPCRLRYTVPGIAPATSRTEQIIANVAGGTERLRNAWLHLEAHALPLMENELPGQFSQSWEAPC